VAPVPESRETTGWNVADGRHFVLLVGNQLGAKAASCPLVPGKD
jgi:hypothetical protein